MRTFRALALPLAIWLLAAAGSPAIAQTTDLRTKYGTNSLEAARQIRSAMDLSDRKKSVEALTAIEAAVKADPQCQMARFCHALILGDLGKIDQAIEDTPLSAEPSP